jgi:hypothetical protein
MKFSGITLQRVTYVPGRTRFMISATLATSWPLRQARTCELMERMGHSTTRTAIVYLHSTDERQRKVADAWVIWPGRSSGTTRNEAPPGAHLARIWHARPQRAIDDQDRQRENGV